MSIHHDAMLCCLFEYIHIVVVHRLRVVVVATWYDVAHIASLHSVVAIFVHKVERIVEVTLVVLCARRCLVVHHQLHALGVCILVEIFYVKVRIRSDEVEHVALPHVRPVFPADVPSLNQHLVETICGGEVDILLHMCSVGTVAAVRSELGVVGLSKLY